MAFKERLEQKPAATFFVGDTASPRFIGWSCNLQSQPGARRHIPSLTRLLERHAQDEGGRNLVELHGAPMRGTHFQTRQEMHEAIQQWFENTREETIGDAERFGRAPWISVESSVGIVDLNADTSRRAIERTGRMPKRHLPPYVVAYKSRRSDVASRISCESAQPRPLSQCPDDAHVRPRELSEKASDR
jgi:hypothetical protein